METQISVTSRQLVISLQEFVFSLLKPTEQLVMTIIYAHRQIFVLEVLVPGSNPVICQASDQCHVSGICNPSTGLCSNPSAQDGTQCDDHNLCSISSACSSGTCLETAYVDCSTPPNQCYLPGSCSQSSGTCNYPTKSNGTTCNDGNPCTLNDVCISGTCHGTAKSCAAEDQCNYAATCDITNGICSAIPKTGTSCNDGNACTQTDTCSAQGVCIGSNLVVCSAPTDTCHTAATCDTGSGKCIYPVLANGTSCDDGDLCSLASSCSAGVCTAIAFLACPAIDQCHQIGVCVAGYCTYQPKTNGVGCNDNNACTSNDICTNGVCAGTGIHVSPDQCHSAATCDTTTGICNFSNLPQFTACNDSDPCTTVDACVDGVCLGSAEKICNTPGNCQVVGSCDSNTGDCVYPTAPDGTGCNYGSNCSQSASCVSGVCTVTSTVPCVAPGPCWFPGTCNLTTGSCEYQTKPFSTGCNDGLMCTYNDACDNFGNCIGLDVECQPLDQCHDAGVCDSNTGICSNPPSIDGTLCSDNNACTQNDTCLSGKCKSSYNTTCPTPGTCYVQGICNPTNGVCSNPQAANGTNCVDNDLCSLTSVCETGVCKGTSFVSCPIPDPSGCQISILCNSSSGVCEYLNKTDGASCSDENACTHGDSCQKGVCIGINTPCSSADQCHLAGTCNTATGVCSYPQKANGTVCDDGNSCTLNDACQIGICSSSVSVICSASDQCHVVGICDPTTGDCSNPIANNGTQCSDGNACTQTDACFGGICFGQNPITCSALDQCHVAGVCNQATGQCSNPVALDGLSCNDGNQCTQKDECSNGTCVGTNPVICTALDQCHDAGICDSSTGVCSNPNTADGNACHDSNACSLSSSCQNGICTGANWVQCEALDQCHSVGVCNPSDGTCSNPVHQNGTLCSDGDACTLSDACISGVCIGSNSVICSALDQCHDIGHCNQLTGICTNPPISDGTPCNVTDDQCVLSASCSLGLCVAAEYVQCIALDQCHVAGVCDKTTGTCSNPSAVSGTHCNIADKCVLQSSCINGSCSAQEFVTCTAYDQCHSVGQCNSDTGLCSDPLAENGKPCSSSDLCGLTWACNFGTCQATSSVQCVAQDSCHAPGVCDPLTRNCSNPALADGTSCPSSSKCISTGLCSSGVCLDDLSTAKICQAVDQCHDIGVCDSTTGECTNPILLDGTPCNDANQCTFQDQCTNGICNGTEISGCTPGGPPYILLTTETPAIVPTQTVWLQLWFKGLAILPHFKITVLNYPNFNDTLSHNYAFGYVDYPSGRSFTMLYREEQLSPNEIDYAAIKLNPPQDQGVQNITLHIQVNYTWNGVDQLGYHTVLVPVDPSVGDFVVLTQNPVGYLQPGESSWFPIQFWALSRLLNFEVTLSSTVLTFDYPSNTGNYTSFFLDSFINVGESDFVAVRVTAPDNATEGTQGAILDVNWKGTQDQMNSIAVSFEIATTQLFRRSNSDFTISTTQISVPANQPMWILVNIIGGTTDMIGAYATLQPISGQLDVSYASGQTFSQIGNINAGTTVFAPVQVTVAATTVIATFTVIYSTFVSTMFLLSRLTLVCRMEPSDKLQNN